MTQKTITFEELQSREFSTKGISNYELSGKCEICNQNFKYSAVKKFMQNRKSHKELWQSCSKCWFITKTSNSPEWIEKNRQAQLIAQNKPEQKRKNALAVSKSWTEARKKDAKKFLEDRWKNDPVFVKKALKNIQWTNGEDIKKFNECMHKSIGSGGLKGEYKGLQYDSALELSYIMWCEDRGIKIERYNLSPIIYKDENKKSRTYVPDFIINEDTVVEIKGLRLYYAKNYNRNILKIKSAKKIYSYKYIIIFSDDEILKINYRKARSWHHENKVKKNN
jgi:hypothetical protein